MRLKNQLLCRLFLEFFGGGKRAAVPGVAVPELAGGHAVDDQAHEADRQRQAYAEGVKSAALRLVPLVGHQVVESTAQTGDEGDQEQYNCNNKEKNSL